MKEKRTLDQSQFGLFPGVDLSGFLSDSESYVLGASTGSIDVGQKLEGSTRQMEPAEWEVKHLFYFVINLIKFKIQDKSQALR